MLGLLDSNSRWAATMSTGDGEFRTGVEAPAEGEYRVILATMVAGRNRADVEVREIGLVGLVPASHRVAPGPKVVSTGRRPWRWPLGS